MRVELPLKPNQIRQLDIRRDLLPVADLIELCFSSTLDPDGREYLRQIRRAAVEPAYLSWMPGSMERVSIPLFGYIAEQDNRVVGNLSMIPIHKNGRWVYLIANVAVHPDYRRTGIARDLTRRAIAHIREHHVSAAWLQVRDDNPAAQALYREAGFVERSRRANWVSRYTPPAQPMEQVSVVTRRSSDWAQQLTWLKEVYPPDVTWNLPYDSGRFTPDFWGSLWRWLNGEIQEHWAARSAADDQALGFASWEPQRSLTDQLWISAPPESEDMAIRALLPRTARYLASRRRATTINYPADRAVQAFMDCGYVLQNTLIWMEHRQP